MVFPALSPSSNTRDSTRPLISRDFKTWSVSEKVKRVVINYNASDLILHHIQQQLLKQQQANNLKSSCCDVYQSERKEERRVNE